MTPLDDLRAAAAPGQRLDVLDADALLQLLDLVDRLADDLRQMRTDTAISLATWPAAAELVALTHDTAPPTPDPVTVIPNPAYL